MIALGKIKELYRSLPPWMTAFVKYVPDSVLFGKSYRTCVPTCDVGAVQTNLKTTLDYSREHTEWGRLNIPKTVALKDAESIVRQLPTVTSEQLRGEVGKFVSNEATAFNSYWTTTGETGKNPTNVCLSNSSYGIEWAHMLAIWRLGGYVRKRDLKLTLRGYHFRPGEVLRRDPIYNEIGLDSFQLSGDNLHMVFDKIRKAGVSCIHGYPTLINSFMERLQDVGLRLKVREIMLGSEGASAAQKETIGKFFDAKVLSWYGLTEKVVLAYDECADNRFKVFTSYGYPWIMNPDADGIGEIVGTTFVNNAMPLVNYQTGDYGKIIHDGNCMYIVQLQGRSGKDFILESPEIKYPVTAINLPGGVQDKIVFYQIVQNEYAKIEVLVLPRSEFASKASAIQEELLGEIKSRLSNFEVSVRIVDDESVFDRSKRGKLRMVVQNIPA